MKGLLITFEGSEGSGKSTQINLVRQYLGQQGKDVLFLREPGGVRISEAIRNILLDVENKEMGKECETLLYMAARAQLVEEKIKPALLAGKVVLCDRFLDSTIVYQGYGFGVDIDFIREVGRFATQGIQPDLTLVFDIDAAVGLSRLTGSKDRIELRSMDYHERVRQGYLELASQHPETIKCLRVNKSKEAIYQEVRALLDPLLNP